MTVLFWSRISDHLGRRPIIMTGLLANSVSMYCFGLSRTFWGLVVRFVVSPSPLVILPQLYMFPYSGSLNGVLNGNIGVVKSMLAEIADPSHIAQASALMLVALSVGSAIGSVLLLVLVLSAINDFFVRSVIGGSLSRPAERFPSVFGEYEFLKRYPYFLPCSIPAALSALACVITFLYLKEVDDFYLPLPRTAFDQGCSCDRLCRILCLSPPTSLPIFQKRHYRGRRSSEAHNGRR